MSFKRCNYWLQGDFKTIKKLDILRVQRKKTHLIWNISKHS